MSTSIDQIAWQAFVDAETNGERLEGTDDPIVPHAILWNYRVHNGDWANVPINRCEMPEFVAESIQEMIDKLTIADLLSVQKQHTTP